MDLVCTVITESTRSFFSEFVYVCLFVVLCSNCVVKLNRLMFSADLVQIEAWRLDIILL